jgi:hypothetical protein
MKIELNGGRSSDIAEIRTESVTVLDQHLEMGVPEQLPAVKITLGPVRTPQMWNALKKTISTCN